MVLRNRYFWIGETSKKRRSAHKDCIDETEKLLEYFFAAKKMPLFAEISLGNFCYCHVSGPTGAQAEIEKSAPRKEEQRGTDSSKAGFRRTKRVSSVRRNMLPTEQ
jgi:hypothetical protein